ncbi:hypothetical protein NM208_g1287 [Fusarium decemcellulare]|uniref:Uncharacterized protein n=1 Tax=Fusarium decemcellulare TaxID=57161 RepID=A0ACC1SWM4_9HYPO|nr:hypothetical protein NM208_g1287 [Fusarium decemcellulare]
MTSQTSTGDDALGSRKPTIIAVVASVLAVAFILVSLRVYTRAVILRNLGIDDACVIFAYVSTVACGLLVALNTRNGFGAHQSTLTDEQFVAYMKMFYFSIVVYNIALAAIKTAFLLQYYRAMTVHKLKKAYVAALAVVGVWSISQILLYCLACQPISAFWDKSVKGSCVPANPSWYINAAGNIATDILILLLPLPIIRKLQLGRRQKVILMSIFCLGFFTCTISVIRIRFLNIQGDLTWHNVEAAGWSVGELCSGIACVCLPTLRPLVSHHFPSFSSRNASYGIAEDSRGGINISQAYGSRGHEMNRLPPSIHSSESKDQLYVSHSAVVIRTDISQEVHLSAHGGEQTTQHISIKAGDSVRTSSSDGNDGQVGSVELQRKEDPRTVQSLQVKEFT